MLDISTINPYIRVAMRSVLSANKEIKRRIIFDYELIYIADGEFVLGYNDVDYRIEKGQFVLLRPGVPHSFFGIRSELSQPHIHFDITHLDNSTQVPVSFKDMPAMSAVERSLIRDDIFTDYPKTPFVEFSRKEKVLELFYDVIDSAQASPLSAKAKLIQIIEAIIADNFSGVFKRENSAFRIEAQIKDYIDAGQGMSASLEDIAKQFCYSKYYLDRRFKESYGIGIIAYRNEKRLQSARELLQRDSVSAVAQKLGFSSIYVFSRAFKYRFGVAPTEFSKKNYTVYKRRKPQMICMKTNGVADWAAQFLQNEQLKDRELWKKFVDLFRSQPDGENRGWRGEYWGKMMRGAALVYEYTRDDELYDILTESVKDMLTVAEPDGRVSTYTRDTELDAWDLWCRKYVILACEYYLDICKDEQFKKQILGFICGCADYIIKHIGDGEGQKNINDATGSWLGLNSSSILEPMVRLYRLTGSKRYLDFATYIVKEGGAKGINVFKLAYQNEVYPYQYGVSKAYEMTSCFEGLLEYYYATGDEWCKTAVINFANALIDTEISVIGCSGITHELFDYTSARQTVRQEDVLQETCVTVTWMKFCSRLLELTGDSRYADCMEQSFYNAYLGAFNTDRKISPYIRQKFIEKLGMDDIVDTYLPVDSYSPLLSGRRGLKVGGNQLLPDLTYYGCCTCIASAGVGVFMKQMVTAGNDGITVNFFENGSATLQYDGGTVEIIQKTDYPTDGKIKITVRSDRPREFELRVRVPAWTGKKDSYLVYKKEWSDDTVELDYQMNIRTQLPKIWQKEVIYTDMSNMEPGNHTASAMTVYHNPDDDNYIALMRGPITLAADSRSGKAADSVFDFEPVGEVCDSKEIVGGVPCLLKMRFTDKNGEDFYLVDYSSAGKDWQTDIAAWLRTK